MGLAQLEEGTGEAPANRARAVIGTEGHQAPSLTSEQTSAELAGNSNLKERRASREPADWHHRKQLCTSVLALLARSQQNLESSCLPLSRSAWIPSPENRDS